MHSDPIADMLTRIRNATAVHHETVKVPYSRITAQLAELFAREGFLKGVDDKKEGSQRYLFLALKYNEGNLAVIQGVRRMSKPGNRVYVKAKNIKAVKYGYGRAIISTPKGLMTEKDARKQGVGGEFVCAIW